MLVKKLKRTEKELIDIKKESFRKQEHYDRLNMSIV